MIVSPSESLSSFKTSFWDPVLVTVASSLTASVSSTAEGVSFTPVTVIVNVAVSVAVPSVILYVKESVAVSLASKSSAAL